MKSVLCVTDFSTNSNHAFQYALALAEKIKSKIFLLHAYESPVPLTEMAITAIYNSDELIKDNAEKKLKLMKNKASEKFPDVDVETIVDQGIASDLIIRYADKHDTDMIIMGKTGAGKVERFIIGSTASKVVQHANCMVLCIPKGKKFQ